MQSRRVIANVGIVIPTYELPRRHTFTPIPSFLIDHLSRAIDCALCAIGDLSRAIDRALCAIDGEERALNCAEHMIDDLL